MLEGTGFDRRTLALGTNARPLPAACKVVVIGGGLLGMVAAQRLLARGHEVVILTLTLTLTLALTLILTLALTLTLTLTLTLILTRSAP
jgi:hypothetical protein